MEDLVHQLLYYPTLFFYLIVFHFLQWWSPPKKMSLKCDQQLDGIKTHEWEWELEKIRKHETHIIEGSTSDGCALYIEVTTHEKYNSATVFLTVDDETYSGQFNGDVSNDVTISCGPLLIEMREPFRKWRVVFRGNLSNFVSSEEKYMSFAGWWRPTSDARFFYSNATLNTFMPTIIRNPFDLVQNVKNIQSLTSTTDLTLYGQLFVEMKLDSGVTNKRFRGLKARYPSNQQSSSEEFHVYLDDGNRVSYRDVSLTMLNDNVQHGYVTRSDRVVRSVSLVNKASLDVHNQQLLQFDALGKPTFSVRKDQLLSEHVFTTSNKKVVTLRRVSVVHGLSKGIALFRTVRESFKDIDEPHFEKFEEYTASPSEKLFTVLSFTHRACTDKLLTGGKGANLALLTSIENEFTVPHGAVVTTVAFVEHLDTNRTILNLFKSLGEHGIQLEECIEIGESVQTELLKSSINDEISRQLEKKGIQRGLKYAVRSSAVGEDGSELSSAGQLESALNVEFDEIPAKIIECWCSNFRREVITYRRTYGQILNPPMAVVVQQMIVDGVAGVMFTADPVSNDDGRMVINAIKGLGEEIVSGAVTPDEITVMKKGREMVKPEPCCLDPTSLNNLISTGLFLEKTFGKPQDVEFVVKDGDVYLVQSRDVTGRDRESHFELITEFDDGTLTDKEMMTTANIGEVCPFPWAALERDVLFDIYDKILANLSLRDLGAASSRHFPICFLMHGGRNLFNMGEMFLRQHEIFSKDRLAEISMGGTELFTEEMFEQARQRYDPLPSGFAAKRMLIMLKTLFFTSRSLLKEVAIKRRNAEMLTPKGDISLERLFKIHEQQRNLTSEVIDCHTGLSMFSSFTYIIVGMLIRGSEVGGMSQEMLSDFANVFSNCSNVISADVPAALKKLARTIRKEGFAEEFAAADDKVSLEIIREKGKESAQLLGIFLNTHGHRGPKELYLRAVSWAEQPEQLVHTLKTMMFTEDDENLITEVQRSTDEIIDSLKCQPTGIRRTLMKYMVKQTHRGVSGREFAKNCLVKTVFELRTTTKMMGRKLVNEGFIPDEDLMFFMSIHEMKELYSSRSARIVSRALRRRKAFADLEDRQYPHIIHGNPEPVDFSHTFHTSTSASLSGTVVCEGTVIARARVAKTLDEARDTKPGEILITRCTDICWSPFFPIIKGIVTEIGGLLSHGAVVAREYGLPSLIAVEHATHIFKSGDLVELNTTKGTISKIVEDEDLGNK